MSEYIKNKWTSYDPNLPDADQPDAFLTKEKLDHMEDGIAQAAKSGGIIDSDGNIIIIPEIEIGEVTEGDTAAAEIVNGKLNLTIPRGAQGPAGEVGPQGEQGEQGEKGMIGDPGPKGDKGDTGYAIYVSMVEVSDNDTIKLTDIRSPYNIKAYDHILAPDGTVRQIISTTEDSVTVSSLLFSIKGAQGTQGPKGDQGETGEQGPKGDAGEGLTGTASTIEKLAEDADNAVIIAKTNEIIDALVARGVLV